MRPCYRPIPILLALGVALLAQPAAAVTGVVRVTDGVTSIALEPQHLEALGLSLAHVRETAQLPDEERMVFPGPPISFRIEPAADLSFRIKNGGFAGFVSESPVTLQQQGGFSLAAKSMGRAASPAFLYDFSVRLDPSAGDSWVKLTFGETATPFDIRSGSALFLSATNELRIPMGDVLLSESYAKEMGRPELAGEWIGTFDLRLTGTLERTEVDEDDKPRGDTFIDVKLGQLYGIDDAGRTGTFPNGMLGLAFATTSCNVGTADVPWLAPMLENHPTIGMALFRIMNDRLEMVGQSWCKHGFFALSSSQCTPCQHPSDGSFLGVGCSDTYAFSNNSSQFYLGPRSEINPYTASWRCFGSYFDGQPVDCVRSFFGNGLNGVEHRLEVAEADLANPGATYFYEGAYYVREDVDHTNNIGWRQCTMSYAGGGAWTFTTVGGGVLPNLGTVIATWGDVHDTAAPDPIDGEIMSATKVTDLGDGQWHYEIALYNRTSDRGVREVSIPVGGSNLSNIGFHDPDQDPLNQWNAVVANGQITFSTGAFGSPGSNPLTAQKLFNFRFDADREPIPAEMTASLYKPGDPMSTVLDIEAPNGPPTGVVVTPGSELEFALRTDPNPFAEATRVSFVMPVKGSARLEVLDVTGRSIRTLVNGEAAAGSNMVEWNGRDEHGKQVVSGVYFFRIETNGAVRTIKGTLLR